MPWPPAAMAPSTPHWTPPPRQNACWMPSHGCAMFDLVELRAAVTAHTRVARIVIAGFDGSSPREVGAAMLVWQGGQSGTIARPPPAKLARGGAPPPPGGGGGRGGGGGGGAPAICWQQAAQGWTVRRWGRTLSSAAAGP